LKFKVRVGIKVVCKRIGRLAEAWAVLGTAMSGVLAEDIFVASIVL
jgi:hypothetical protein